MSMNYIGNIHPQNNSLHNPGFHFIFHCLFHLILHYWGDISLDSLPCCRDDPCLQAFWRGTGHGAWREGANCVESEVASTITLWPANFHAKVRAE